MTPLFETLHGSTLYGLATPTSDHDFYRVVARLPNVYEIRPKKYAKQRLRDLDDVLTVDLSTWLHLCEKGVPQALEAMFSQQATIDILADFRRSYRVGTAVLPTYLRTIKGMAYKGEHDRKFRRHAARLAFNARDIREFGRFDPLLSEDQKEQVFQMADHYVHPDDLMHGLHRVVFA